MLLPGINRETCGSDSVQEKNSQACFFFEATLIIRIG